MRWPLKRRAAVQVETAEVEVAEEPVPTVPCPTPAPVDVLVEDYFDEYLRLAGTLGLDNPEYHNWALPRFLQREEIPIYPIDQVEAFLAQEARKVGKVWCWSPLLHDDVERMWHNDRSQSIHGHLGEARYLRQVPIEALRIVDKIRSAFPHVAFYVSDYPHPDPDPFLMVSAIGAVDDLVVYHWNEPSFKLLG